MALTEEQKAEAISRLYERGAGIGPCSACGGNEHFLADHLALILVQKEQPWSPQRHIPAIVVVCKQCGLLRQHALDPLGLNHLE